MSIEPLGDSALLVRLNDSLERLLAAHQALSRVNLPGVIEIAPAYVTVGVFYDPTVIEFDALAGLIADTLEQSNTPATTQPARMVDIPVCYGGDYGPDLDNVAKHTDLTSDEVIARHAAAEY